MSELNDIYYEFYEFQQLLQEITAKLNQATMMQNHMHWQFNYPTWYENFADAINNAKDGWMSSHC